MAGIVHVVELDTRNTQTTDITRYVETTCDMKFWKEQIVNNPRVIMIPSSISQKCGMNIKMYVAKYKKGLNQFYKEQGFDGVNAAIMADSGILSSNNGGGTLLNVDIDTGYADWIVCGKAYVVCDDGKYPLSKSQLWGLVEMVNCLMDIYDADPAIKRIAKHTFESWAKEYKKKIWEPPTRAGGVALYQPKALD